MVSILVRPASSHAVSPNSCKVAFTIFDTDGEARKGVDGKRRW
jgi:hypothetical protein